MMAENWIAITVILSNLLAPLLARLFDLYISSSQPEGVQRRRKTDRQGSRLLPEMAWLCLPFVLALSLDIYIVVNQTNHSRPLLGSDLRLNDLVLFMAGLQVLAMARLAGLNLRRSRDAVLATALAELRAQHEATQESLRVGLDAIAMKLDNQSDETADIRGRVAEQLPAPERMPRQIEAANRAQKTRRTQSQESLPERKPDIRRRRDASR